MLLSSTKKDLNLSRRGTRNGYNPARRYICWKPWRSERTARWTIAHERYISTCRFGESAYKYHTKQALCSIFTKWHAISVKPMVVESRDSLFSPFPMLPCSLLSGLWSTRRTRKAGAGRRRELGSPSEGTGVARAVAGWAPPCPVARNNAGTGAGHAGGDLLAGQPWRSDATRWHAEFPRSETFLFKNSIIKTWRHDHYAVFKTRIFPNKQKFPR